MIAEIHKYACDGEIACKLDVHALCPDDIEDTVFFLKLAQMPSTIHVAIDKKTLCVTVSMETRKRI